MTLFTLIIEINEFWKTHIVEESRMRYLIAILLPPLAVLLCGKPIQFVLNIFLTLLVYVPGMIHAILVVHNYYADKRTDRIVKAVKEK